MAFLLILAKKKQRRIKMPIVKCECKECEFYNDKLYCCNKDIVELKTYGQCVEGIKMELNQALKEQRAAVVPYYNYNTYYGGKDI